MKFVVAGELNLSEGKRAFSKEVEAPSEGAARDKIYALFGSYNRLSRSKVIIATISKA